MTAFHVTNLTGSQRNLSITPFYKRERVPAAEPLDEPSVPGKLCWGTVGALPSPELADSLGFTVTNCMEEHIETTREYTVEEIVDENDPDNKVTVERPTKISYNKTERTSAPSSNTSTAEPEGIGDFSASPVEFSAFQPLGTETEKRCRYTVTIDNGPLSI